MIKILTVILLLFCSPTFAASPGLLGTTSVGSSGGASEGGGSPPAGECAGTEIFCDGFDNCTSASEPDANCDETWTANGTDVFIVTADAGDGGSGDQAIYIDGTAGDHVYLEGDFTRQTADFTISMKISFNACDAYEYAFFRILDDTTVIITIRVINWGGTYNVEYYDGASYQLIDTISTGTYFTLTISDINFTNDTCDYDVDGTTINDGELEVADASGADNFSLGYGSGSSVDGYIDEVKAY